MKIFPTLSQYFGIVFISLLASQIYAQRQPRNITRGAGETDVFISCPFEFRPTPSIWRINNIDFTTATIPSTLYTLTPGGLFINEVLVCMNQTFYQCIDTSDDVLQEQVSETGYLTVTSNEICPDGGQEELLLATGRPDLELSHLNTVYGVTNITLAWTILPPDSGCNISHILSYRPCEQNNPDINEIIDNTSITIPSMNLSIGGQLADFAISSLSNQESLECPRLQETVRFNVNKTEQINLLLGNNTCTSVLMERRGGLSFVISNPNPDEVDVICSIYTENQCYSPDACNNFNGIIAPFFRICEDLSVNSYNLLFDNVTRQLNGTRLDFFITTKTICQSSGAVYYTRTYVRSFELSVRNASSDITINTTLREICFSSQSIDCYSNLTLLTQYNLSIIDISNNIIFEMDQIPESTCLTVDQLRLLPQCGPFTATTRPFNNYIVYDADRQQITLDNNENPSDEPNLCSCLEATTQLQLTTEYNSSESLLKVDYLCTTIYATQIRITISDNSSLNFTNITTCSEGKLEFSIDRDLCGRYINFCGYFTFENGSAFTDCAITSNCSTVSVVCPTTVTPNTSPTPVPIDVIIGSILGPLTFLILMIIFIVLGIGLCYARRRHTTDSQEAPGPGHPPPNGAAEAPGPGHPPLNGAAEAPGPGHPLLDGDADTPDPGHPPLNDSEGHYEPATESINKTDNGHAEDNED